MSCDVSATRPHLVHRQNEEMGAVLFRAAFGQGLDTEADASGSGRDGQEKARLESAGRDTRAAGRGPPSGLLSHPSPCVPPFPRRAPGTQRLALPVEVDGPPEGFRRVLGMQPQGPQLSQRPSAQSLAQLRAGARGTWRHGLWVSPSAP